MLMTCNNVDEEAKLEEGEEMLGEKQDARKTKSYCVTVTPIALFTKTKTALLTIVVVSVELSKPPPL